MQSHLLRVLQDQLFYRVGGTQPVQTNVRFIAATNKDLRQAIRQGAFREDLYYRLDVITLTLPPLRERMDDLPALVQYFLGRSIKLGHKQCCVLSTAALNMLQHYPWPGNIRELENVLTRAIVLCAGSTIEPEHLYLSAGQTFVPQESETLSSIRPYHEAMEAYSCKVLEDALRRNGWNQTRAAEDLKLQRTYFTKLLRQKQISGRPPTESAPPHSP